jgi:tetratricopeptide (TPR) repeat protein
VKPRRKKSTHKQRHLSVAKRRVFFAITVSFPLLLFLFLEVGLLVFKYGPNLSLFVTEEIAGRTYHIMNPDVKGRYFSKVEFSPNTSMDYFSVPKPDGAFRIFCLGGSTTAGYPYGYIGSFSSYLRDRLHRLFPERKIEVINLGLTATNSFTVNDFARELVDYEPDLLIVYDGHNEFYGALGIASHESLGEARWLAKAYLRLIHLRTSVLSRDIYGRIAGFFSGPSDPNRGGTMMERLALGQYIPLASETYRDGLSIFRANLEELVSICSSPNIPLMLSSQVSNLRDQPPFISGNSESYAPDKRLEINNIYNRGISYFLDGEIDSALGWFRQAAALDSQKADIRYDIARGLDSLGRKREARIEYILARDYDQLRFRTSSDFNKAMRDMENGSEAVFVDIEQAFANHSPDSIIGNELILEHLHPNTRGYFLMAKEYARAMRNKGLLAPTQEWIKRDTISDESLWQSRNLTELDEMCAKKRTEILTSSWPFRTGTKTVPPADARDRIGQIVDQIITGKIAWERGHVAAAEYYEGQGEYDKAEKEYLALIHEVPVNVSPYLILAQLYLKGRKYEQARTLLLRSLEVEQTTYAYRTLGGLAVDGGMPREAITYLEKAFALSKTVKERTDNGYLLALAFKRAEMPQQAIAQLQHVVDINPNFRPAKELLRRMSQEK